MFGYSRNSGINWFRDYGDAFHKYQSTTDIRGRTVEPKRPLGQRKSVDMYSIRLKDDGSMGVECVLYKTPVVTYYPTGLIELRSDGWASASTVAFIDEVTGCFRARIFNGSLCVSVQGVETRLEDNTVLQIMNGKILNPTTDKTHKVDRAKANNVRKHYAEFMKYASALVRLKAGQFTMMEIENVGLDKDLTALGRFNYSDFHTNVRSFFALVNTDEDKHTAHYKATIALARAFGSVSWGAGYSVTGCHITEQRFKDKFDELMMGYHRDEVLVQVDREEGIVRKDPYRKYYEGGWRKLHEQA